MERERGMEREGGGGWRERLRELKREGRERGKGRRYVGRETELHTKE